MRGLLRCLNAYARQSRGAAAMELAIVVGLMTLPALNIVDMAVYAFDEMQTHNAAEMAAESAFNDCNIQGELPALTACTASNSQWSISVTQAMGKGIQETTLGNAVALNSDSEGYYCSTTSNTIVAVSASTQTCTGDADADATPGDYILITASYTYTPIFKGVTVTSLLPSIISKTVYIRMN